MQPALPPVAHFGLRLCSGTPTPVMDVREEELQDLYMWVDGIPLSRPKRNIARDFSDGGMCESSAQLTCSHLLYMSPPPPQLFLISLLAMPRPLHHYERRSAAVQCSWQRSSTTFAPAWSSFTTTGLQPPHAPPSTCATVCVPGAAQ